MEQNKDVLYRLKPRVNPDAQGYFMCDEGRFGWKYVHSDRRLTTPIQRAGGAVVSQSWEAVLPAARQAIESTVKAAPKRFAALISPWSTVEEAALLAKSSKGYRPM